MTNWRQWLLSFMLFSGFSVGTALADPGTAINVQETSQQKSVAKGVVKDAQDVIVGASVVVKGTTNGTITDFDGNFSLSNVKVGDVLQISYVGFVTQEVKWTGKPVNVVLVEDAQSLEELVVVGFGVQKKVDVTGAVSQVKMDDVKGDRPVINAANALQGAMPGLMVSGASGPGQSKTFNIRGDLSINGGSPLVLIDNVEGDIDALNPDDIESVSVLKDAASSAIYGARAACGVVLITTKRPKKDTKFSFDYSFNQGWENSIGRPQQASLDDYITAYEEAGYSQQYWAGNGHVDRWKELLGQYRSGSLQGVYDNGIYKDTDGRIYYLKEGDPQGNALETGALSNHNMSVTGGTDKLRFRLSGNYSYENGPMVTDKDKYTRKALSAYVSGDITPWYTQDLTMYYTDTNRTALSGNIRDPFATRLISWYPEGYMPADIIGYTEDLIVDSPRNSYLVSPVSTTTNSIPRIQARATFKPLAGWDIVAEYTYNQNNYRYNHYTGVLHYGDVQLAHKTYPTQADRDTYTINHQTTKYNAINVFSTYKKKIQKHDFSVMVGFNQESYDYSVLNTSIEGQAVTTVPSFGGGTGNKNISDSYSEYTIRGGFGRLTYNFDDRYLLTVNARYDGSSKFPKVNRYGFFPSVSAAWRVTQEKFMEGTREWLDDLKIRGSYGSIGNQNISPYGFVAGMSVAESTVWLDGNKKVTTISTPGLIRANYTWEKVNSLDFGFDLVALKNRLSLSFDWYKRDTKGMLADGIELPSTVGAAAPLQNVADMSTTGWELNVTWQDRIGDFGYRIGFNVYDHMSKITKYNNESGLLSEYYVGRKFGEIWGYVSDGYYSIDDFEPEKAKLGQWVLKEGVTSINGVTVQPGDEKFKDLDNNGVINTGANTLDDPGDRKIIGNTTSRFQFGANLGVSWKGFDLSAMLQGVGKRDYALGSSALYPFGGAGADGVFWPVYYNQTDYWQAISYDPNDANYMVPKNPNAKLFRIYGQEGNSGSNTRTSDKYLQNAAYLRIKNVTLSYAVPTSLVKPWGINKLRVYVSVENLGTISSLPKGYDPESLAWSYPFYRTWSFGANISF